MTISTTYSSRDRISLLSAWPLAASVAVSLPYAFLSTALILPYLLLITSTLLLVWMVVRALVNLDTVTDYFFHSGILAVVMAYVLYLYVTPWLHEGVMTGFPTNKYIVLALAYLMVYLLAVLLFQVDIRVFGIFSLWMTVLAMVLAVQFYYIAFFTDKEYDGRGLLFGRHLLAMFLVLTAYLLLHGAAFGRWIRWVLVSLLVITALFCASRTVVLALLVSAGVVVVLYRREWLRMRYLIPAMGLLVAVGIVLYFLNPDSMDGRLLLWKIGLSSLDAGNIWLGRGAGFMEYHLADLQGAALRDAALSDRMLAGDVRAVLNEYIRLLVENGVVGCLLAMTLVVWTFRIFLRGCHYMLIGALLFLLLCAISSYPLLSIPIHLLAVILVAYATVLTDRQKEKISIGKRGRFVWYGGGGLIIVSVLTVGFIAGRYASTLYQWHTKGRAILVHYNEPLFYKTYVDFERILGEEPAFVSDYANKLLSVGDTEVAIPLLERAVSIQPTADRYMQLGQGYEQIGSVSGAAEAYEKAVHILPKSFLPKYLLFDLYRQHKDQLFARRWAEEISQHPVKVPSEQVQGIRQEAEDYLKTINTN